MRLPKVVIHNAVSLDGRIDKFTPDIGLFYELAFHWREDATLAGADTLLAAYTRDQIKAASGKISEPNKNVPKDKRPVLVVPDSRGRIKFWSLIRQEPYWRTQIVLCSKVTPKSYIRYLRDSRIDYIIRGKDRVDLKAALKELRIRHKIKVIRVDSGGILNGVLLKADLVDEVSILVHPQLAGNQSRSFFRLTDNNLLYEAINLKLIKAKNIKRSIVWLRYKVIR